MSCSRSDDQPIAAFAPALGGGCASVIAGAAAGTFWGVCTIGGIALSTYFLGNSQIGGAIGGAIGGLIPGILTGIWCACNQENQNPWEFTKTVLIGAAMGMGAGAMFGVTLAHGDVSSFVSFSGIMTISISGGAGAAASAAANYCDNNPFVLFFRGLAAMLEPKDEQQYHGLQNNY